MGTKTKTLGGIIKEIHYDPEEVNLRHSEYGAPSFHFLVEISNKNNRNHDSVSLISGALHAF